MHLVYRLATVQQKVQRESKMFVLCKEYERREQIVLLLVRIYNCRLQFVIFALFAAIHNENARMIHETRKPSMVSVAVDQAIAVSAAKDRYLYTQEESHSV